MFSWIKYDNLSNFNNTLLNIIKKLNISSISDICQMQIIIGNNIYENYFILDQSFNILLSQKSRFDIINHNIMNTIFIIFAGVALLHKISSIILIKFFQDKLLLIVKETLISKNIVFDMTEIEIYDLCLKIVNIILRKEYPITILIEIIKKKWGL